MSTAARAPRNSLSRDRLVKEALELADADGADALTIRVLAARLQVKPMAIYNHVADKREILDALVDAVFAETYLPTTTGAWRDELEHRCRSLHEALRRHPWAVSFLESRPTPGPATLQHHEAVLDVLRTAGFSLPATAHAYAALDAFVFGFALQEAMLDDVGLAEPEQLLAGLDLAGLPRMAEFAAGHVMQPGYAFVDSFEVGLAIVLDGIAVLEGLQGPTDVA